MGSMVTGKTALVVIDLNALVNFQRTRRDGVVVPPRDVLEMSLANLMSFATVVESDAVLADLGV